MRRAHRVAVLAATAGLVFLGGNGVSAHAVNVDDPSRVWIKGQTYKQTSDGCALPGLGAVLQFRVNGEWTTVAKGKEKASKKCRGYGAFKYVTTYTFTVKHLGIPIPGERPTLLEVRETWTAYGKPQKNEFTKYVYKSARDHELDLLDCLTDPTKC